MTSLKLLFVTLALWIAGCGGGGSGGNPLGLAGLGVNPGGTPVATDLTNRIYVVAARQGSVGAGSAAQDYAVTLTDVGAEVDWYTDRPARLTGEASTQSFIGTDWPQVYGSVAPNALLQFQNAGGVHALFGSVHNPAYDPAARTLRFTLRLAKASHDIGAGAGSVTAPVLTVLNNLQPPAEGSSFALQAGQTNLVPDGQGGYRLVLQQVPDAVFWMNNAPARAGEFESVSEFVARWPGRFAKVPPNASLAGDPGTGDYDIVPLTLSEPRFDSAARSVSFTATPLQGASLRSVGKALRNTVLFVDSGARTPPASVFAQTWRGVAYSAIPAQFNSNPTGAFFDSDLTADAFQAVWGSKDGCGRNDLEAMAAAGVNLVRLYDYNYQRGSTQWTTAGAGHIAFLDKAQSLGVKVIVPVSNYNFMRQDGANRPWDNIEHTVTQIVDSTRKNGVIHPAVHSFSVGNELDLDKYGMTAATLIPDAVKVAGLLHGLAPDHYITIPISNADEKKFYRQFRDLLPASLYQTRFYNAVQTFKFKDGLVSDILRPYDALELGVPLVITELGTSNQSVPSVDAKVDTVLGQASAVRGYMDANPASQVKGFAIFEWQNAHWKRGGSTNDNSESTFGIQAYSGSLCASTTGAFYMEGMVNGNYAYASFHKDERYEVDKLVPLTSAAHPEGLLSALSAYFK